METIEMILITVILAAMTFGGVQVWLIFRILAKQSRREELYYKGQAGLYETMAEQEGAHQTERRELYQRIQGSPVYVEPLLTREGGSGMDKGNGPEIKDPDQMSPEELARIGVVQNADGGFIDTRSKDKGLYDTAKDLLFFREEATKEKESVANAFE